MLSQSGFSSSKQYGCYQNMFPIAGTYEPIFHLEAPDPMETAHMV